MRPTEAYPLDTAARDRWIRALRPPRRPVARGRANAVFVEDEVDDSGIVRRVLTVLVANRECPFTCVMCDLWRDALPRAGPTGRIVEQVTRALGGVHGADVVKLYNSGSFFDPLAIPPRDLPAIASRLASIPRVIVECHPAFVGDAVARFRDLLGGGLEVAMGLETIHEEVLARLNKRMTLGSYAAAARTLEDMGVATRAFVLVQPPFERPEDAAMWAVRSADFAFDHGSTRVSLIPVRPGNGALEALAGSSDFTMPTLDTLEAAVDGAHALSRGRVLADAWDLARFSTCEACFAARAARLHAMNLAQQVAPRIACRVCAA